MPRDEDPRGVWNGSVALVAVAAALALAAALGRLGDNSFLTHLATGRLILERGNVPSGDPYSFTAPGAPWVVQSWLASLLYATVERIGGGRALVLLHALLLAGLGAVVAALTAPLRSLVPRLGIMSLAVAVGHGAWSERPLLFGFLLFGLTLLVLQRAWDPRVLTVVLALWVNLHGSFPFGIVLILVTLVGARLDRAPTSHALRCLGWAGVGCLIGALNPVGPVLLTFPLALLSRADALAGVVEWQAPSFTDLYQRAWLVQVAIAIVLLARRPSYRASLVLTVFVASSLLALRNIPLASLAMLPGMAAGAEGLGSLQARARGAVAGAAVTGAALLAAAIVGGVLREPPFDLRLYPQEVLSLARQELPADARLASHDFVGNYQELVLGEGAAVFYDDRFDMYPVELAQDYRSLMGGEQGWQRILDERAVDAVVWTRGSPLTGLLQLSPRWQVLAQDHRWVLAVRREQPVAR